MTNFIFKSANRLIKNSPITVWELNNKLDLIQSELRHARSDHKDMSLKLEKLLIDKHLQMQVDEYFSEDRPENIPEDDKEPD